VELTYLVNLIGYDEWQESAYSKELSQGDVITRDGEVLGIWRAAGYDLEDVNTGGQYEFVQDGQSSVKFRESFGTLDSRISRGYALSKFSRAIREWYEAQDT